jgi:hypothetical protein
VGDRERADLPAAVEAGDDALSSLVERAHVWVEPYWNARHLERTLDWLLVLEPDAPEPMQLAALTHDMERYFPGGPVIEPARMSPDDEAYLRAHSERSARVVADWLRIEGGSPGLIAEAERLILAHETGGDSDENLIQAADSVSFLEVNPGLVAGWVTAGRCDQDRAKAQLTYMYDRIQLDAARRAARTFYEEGLAVVDSAEVSPE